MDFEIIFKNGRSLIARGARLASTHRDYGPTTFIEDEVGNEVFRCRSEDLLFVCSISALLSGSKVKQIEPVLVEGEEKERGLMKALDYASRGISILSGTAVMVAVALLLSGQSAIGNVQIGTLLTIFSFTLVGGLISIGGVKMFSINTSLRRAKEKIERVVTTAGSCPFLYIFTGQPTELKRPGNPYFCVKCPLGIDTDSSRENGLIHICKVYPTLHRQWKELPGADKILR